MIYSLVESHVREALDKSENYNDDGSVNWDFVDSDCYMSGVVKFFKDDADYYDTWDDVVSKIDDEMKLSSIRAELQTAQLEFNFGGYV